MAFGHPVPGTAFSKVNFLNQLLVLSYLGPAEPDVFHTWKKIKIPIKYLVLFFGVDSGIIKKSEFDLASKMVQSSDRFL